MIRQFNFHKMQFNKDECSTQRSEKPNMFGQDQGDRT